MHRLLLGLLFLAVCVSSQSHAATLEKVRFSQQEDAVRLVFDLSEAVQYKTFTLKNPHRLVIDIPNIRVADKITLPDFTHSMIRKLRYAAHDRHTLRIVLDLKHRIHYQSRLLTSPDRLVLDLSSKKITSKTTTKPAPVKPAATKAAPAAKAVSTAGDSRRETTAAVPLRPSKVLKKRKRDIVIAIDAGHGGVDSGAIGKHGTKEKEVTLAIARQLAHLIDKEPGMRAYLTRKRDIFLPLRQRIKLARDHKANLFISIHADSFTNTRARGASVFVLSERGASSEAAKLLADKENAADLAGGISLEDKDDLLASVLLDLSQTASLEGSLEVANNILAGLKRIGHVHKKYVQSAAFVVLKSPDIPSVLIETAFISNPDEEWKLKNRRHQQKLARAILSGIRNYFKHNPLPDTVQPQQHIVSRGDTLSTIAQRYQVSITELKQVNNLTDSHIKTGDILLIP